MTQYIKHKLYNICVLWRLIASTDVFTNIFTWCFSYWTNKLYKLAVYLIPNQLQTRRFIQVSNQTWQHCFVEITTTTNLTTHLNSIDLLSFNMKSLEINITHLHCYILPNHVSTIQKYETSIYITIWWHSLGTSRMFRINQSLYGTGRASYLFKMFLLFLLAYSPFPNQVIHIVRCLKCLKCRNTSQKDFQYGFDLFPFWL